MSSLSQVRGVGKRTRPLGSLRHTTTSDEKVHLPKLSNSALKHQDGKLDDNYAGIQGSALTVASSREAAPPGQNDRQNTSPSPSSATPKNAKPAAQSTPSSPPATSVSHESCQLEIKEAQAMEGELRKKIAQLQKEVEMLTLQLADEKKVAQNLKQDLQTLEVDYKKRLDEEQCSHSMTRHKAQEESIALQNKLEMQEKTAKENLDKLHCDLTKQMTEMEVMKDKDIADRDQKLSRLKMQMADALKGNSWERQQQLEELTKELARIQEECDVLRGKLKVLTKNKQGDCQNCAQATARAEKLATMVKEKDITIKDLKSLVSKFEKQLSQQDQLLKMWAESKGHKVTISQ